MKYKARWCVTERSEGGAPTKRPSQNGVLPYTSIMDVTEDFSLGEVQAEVDRLLAKSHMYGATPIPGLMNHWAEGFVWYNHNEPMCKESIALFNAGQMLAHYIFCSHGGDIFDD